MKIIQAYMEGYRQDWELSFEKETRTKGGWYVIVIEMSIFCNSINAYLVACLPKEEGISSSCSYSSLKGSSVVQSITYKNMKCYNVGELMHLLE